MRIEKVTGTEITISGNIKSIEDYTLLRGEISAITGKGAREVSLKIPESFSMPSSVIGFLLKLKNREQVKIRIHAGDERLYELLKDLNLISEFGVTLARN